jgi:hypothetical protein
VCVGYMRSNGMGSGCTKNEERTVRLSLQGSMGTLNHPGSKGCSCGLKQAGCFQKINHGFSDPAAPGKTRAVRSANVIRTPREALVPVPER